MMKTDEKTAKLTSTALKEWLERCAIDRCDKEEQAVLARFGRARLLSEFRIANPSLADDLCRPYTEAGKEKNAWYELETYFLLPKGSGKTAGMERMKIYKQRLREISGDVAHSEAMITFLILDLARRLTCEQFGSLATRADGTTRPYGTNKDSYYHAEPFEESGSASLEPENDGDNDSLNAEANKSLDDFLDRNHVEPFAEILREELRGQIEDVVNAIMLQLCRDSLSMALASAWLLFPDRYPKILSMKKLGLGKSAAYARNETLKKLIREEAKKILKDMTSEEMQFGQRLIVDGICRKLSIWLELPECKKWRLLLLCGEETV